MKTIEKANNAAVKAENLEDIVFEGRNQKYGAYKLRKNYNNHLLLSFLAVFIIATLIAGIPLLHFYMNPQIVIEPKIKPDNKNPKVIIVELILPPEPPAKERTSSLTPAVNKEFQIVVTDDPVTDEPMPITDEPINDITPIDNQPYVITEIPVPIPENKPDINNTTFTDKQVTTQAKFKDGPVDNFRKWLARNLYYPLDAINNDIKGTVLLKFSIDKNGKICDITVVRGLDPIIDRAAMNTLRTSPKWTAATIEGKPVKVAYVLPIAFDIKKE
jgi:protein TonB